MASIFQNICLVALMVILHLNAACQLNISGKIVDEENHPVERAGIRVKQEKLITGTDAAGNFSFKASALPVEIVISHPGYHPRVLTIDDTLKHQYKIRTRIYELPEVSINADKNYFGPKHDSLNYLSFELMENYVIALGVKRFLPRNKYLVLFDQAGNQVGRLKVKKNMRSLYKSCTNDIFLLSDDSAYQIYYDYEFTLLYPHTINYFKKVMEPCIKVHHDTMYIRVSRFLNLVNDYYYADIHSTSPDIEKFLTIEDSLNTHDLRSKYSLSYFLNQRNSNANFQFPVDTLLKYQDRLIEQTILEKSVTEPELRALYPPLNTQFVVCNKNLYLIDLQNENLISLNKKMKIQERLPLKGEKQIRLSERILYAEPCSGVYLYYKENGKILIDELDLATGRIKSFKTIQEYPNMINLRMDKNTLYFLYQETGNEGEYKIHYYYLD